MIWRPMLPADLSMTETIAEQVHPDYPEDPAVFAERLALFPAGCFMLGAVGYLIAHPWMRSVRLVVRPAGVGCIRRVIATVAPLA